MFLDSFLAKNPCKKCRKSRKLPFLTDFRPKNAEKCFKKIITRLVFVRLGLKMMILGSKITKNSDFEVPRLKITIFDLTPSEFSIFRFFIFFLAFLSGFEGI